MEYTSILNSTYTFNIGLLNFCLTLFNDWNFIYFQYKFIIIVVLQPKSFIPNPHLNPSSFHFKKLDEYHFNIIQTKHLKLGKHWKITVFYMFFVKRKVSILNTQTLHGNCT